MDCFKTGKGVHQGCVMSPCSFNLYAEYIMWHARMDELQAGIKIFVVVVQPLSCVQLFATPQTAGHQACSNSWPLSQWRHLTNLSSVIPSSSCLWSFPALGSFLMSQFFTSSGQGIGVSASASVPPMNIQDWFPLGWTGWMSLQSKGLSRVFSSTTTQKHQVFCAQPSLWSNSWVYTWLLGKP